MVCVKMPADTGSYLGGVCMKTIVNIIREHVFSMLSAGNTVYMFDSQTEVVMDLRYETINSISEYIDHPQNVFFMIWEERENDNLEK